MIELIFVDNNDCVFAQIIRINVYLTDVLPTSRWDVDIGGVKPGDTVVVLGCGPIGPTSIKWCQILGAKRIIAVDSVKCRLEHARSYGVEVLDFQDYHNTGQEIKEIRTAAPMWCWTAWVWMAICR